MARLTRAQQYHALISKNKKMETSTIFKGVSLGSAKDPSHPRAESKSWAKMSKEEQENALKSAKADNMALIAKVAEKQLEINQWMVSQDVYKKMFEEFGKKQGMSDEEIKKEWKNWLKTMNARKVTSQDLKRAKKLIKAATKN